VRVLVFVVFVIIFLVGLPSIQSSLATIHGENPRWFETVESWYEQNQISEIEYQNAIKFLIKNGIIKTESSSSRILAIYGISDGEQNWNIISSTLDGKDKTVIATFDFSGIGNQRPIHALDVKLSPDGKYFLYSFSKDQNNSLWLVDTDTKEKKLIIKEGNAQRLSEYYWSPNSKKITYSLWDIPPPCPQCGMSLYRINGPWFIYDVANDTHDIIREKTRSLGLVGWWNDDELVFVKLEIPFDTIPIYLYNIHSNKSNLLIEQDHLPAVIINGDEKTRLITSPIISNSCDILVINNVIDTQYHIEESNTTCPSNFNPNFWISDESLKMIYNRGTSPSGGPIGTLDRDDNGTYVISSIYMMNLESQRKTLIFEGKANSPYFILGGWNSQYDVLAYIKIQKGVYSLMISNSDGLSQVKIDEVQPGTHPNQKEIPFYGWKLE